MMAFFAYLKRGGLGATAGYLESGPLGAVIGGVFGVVICALIGIFVQQCMEELERFLQRASVGRTWNRVI